MKEVFDEYVQQLTTIIDYQLNAATRSSTEFPSGRNLNDIVSDERLRGCCEGVLTLVGDWLDGWRVPISVCRSRALRAVQGSGYFSDSY
jgi:hypothetical protein